MVSTIVSDAGRQLGSLAGHEVPGRALRQDLRPAIVVESRIRRIGPTRSHRRRRWRREAAARSRRRTSSQRVRPGQPPRPAARAAFRLEPARPGRVYHRAETRHGGRSCGPPRRLPPGIIGEIGGRKRERGGPALVLPPHELARLSVHSDTRRTSYASLDLALALATEPGSASRTASIASALTAP